MFLNGSVKMQVKKCGMKAPVAIEDPVGSIATFPYDQIPKTYISCEGQSVAKSDYKKLYEVLGNRYNDADDKYFRIPDLRDVLVIGTDDPALLGKKIGASSVQLTTAHLPKHTHEVSVSDPGHSHTILASHSVYDKSNTLNNKGKTPSVSFEVDTAKTGISATVTATGSGAPIPLQNKSVRLIYAVKAG